MFNLSKRTTAGLLALLLVGNNVAANDFCAKRVKFADLIWVGGLTTALTSTGFILYQYHEYAKSQPDGKMTVKGFAKFIKNNSKKAMLAGSMAAAAAGALIGVTVGGIRGIAKATDSNLFKSFDELMDEGFVMLVAPKFGPKKGATYKASREDFPSAQQSEREMPETPINPKAWGEMKDALGEKYIAVNKARVQVLQAINKDAKKVHQAALDEAKKEYLTELAAFKKVTATIKPDQGGGAEGGGEGDDFGGGGGDRREPRGPGADYPSAPREEPVGRRPRGGGGDRREPRDDAGPSAYSGGAGLSIRNTGPGGASK